MFAPMYLVVTASGPPAGPNRSPINVMSVYDTHIARTPILNMWSPQDILAIRIESQVPQPDARHELLRVLELPIPSKNTLHKFNPRILAQLRWRLASSPMSLSRLQHRRLARLQEFLQFVRQPLTGLDEVLDHFAVGDESDARHALFSALDFAGELD